MMYAGHHQDGSSIQKHSAGPIYPYVIQIRDNPRGGCYWELIGGDIEIPIRHESLDELMATARERLRRRAH